VELLAPAGGFSQLKAAIDFGADAVYLAADKFGMRARATNFCLEDIAQATAVAHAQGVKVYVTCNIVMTDEDIEQLPQYFEALDDAHVDAIIISDLGALSLARKYAPHCEYHVSTQASIMNTQAALTWYELGARRIVCARELSLTQIANLKAKLPKDMLLEVFVHGSMCMAVSGRCLISSYLTGRSGNRGHCTQPCRWMYALEEEKRPGQFFPIEEDERGTFIMNAQDLNMLSHLEELKCAGVDSIKIEGRNKKAFYVATVVNAYRQVLDGKDPSIFQEELNCVSHRPYSTGFYFGPAHQTQIMDGYNQSTLHVASVIKCEQIADEKWDIELECHNRFEINKPLEAIIAHAEPLHFSIDTLYWLKQSEDGNIFPVEVDVANRAMEHYSFKCVHKIPEGSFIRIREDKVTSRYL
jgi:U32 family peptidase